jgi:DNA-binding LytR/AlgR family response regulator
MLKILIVEDERIIAENLRQAVIEMGFEVAAVRHRYPEILPELETLEFDIALLDINLGDGDSMSGLEVARHINRRAARPIIFLTAYADRESITRITALQPTGYLVKPVENPNLFAALQLARQQLKETGTREEEHFFYAPVSGGKQKVFWSEIGYINAGKNYCQLWDSRRKRKVLIRSSLRKIMEEWVPAALRSHFIQVNRSCLVAGDSIEGIRQDRLYLTNGEILKMSRSGRVKVRAWLDDVGKA